MSNVKEILLDPIFNENPIGLQILAAPFEEEKILRVAYTFEQNTDHHQRKPNL